MSDYELLICMYYLTDHLFIFALDTQLSDDSKKDETLSNNYMISS